MQENAYIQNKPINEMNSNIALINIMARKYSLMSLQPLQFERIASYLAPDELTKMSQVSRALNKAMIDPLIEPVWTMHVN